MSRIITVTSGKGGVGKTNISVNMALYLVNQGYSACLFDADMGLANVDIMLGLYPEYTLEDVISKGKSLNEIIIRNPLGIDIIPGGSGVEKLADPDPEQIDVLIKSLSDLDNYDFLIFDTSAGISRSVMSFCLASPEIILVITPEPTSLTDAYALLKMLRIKKFDGTVMIAINQCMSMEVANRLYTKFKEVVQQHLKMDIFPIGTIPLDPHVTRAVKEQEALLSIYPNSDAAKGIKNMARHLISRGKVDITDYDLSDFWTKYLDFMNSGSKVSNRKKTADPSSGKLPVEEKRKLLSTEPERPVEIDEKNPIAINSKPGELPVKEKPLADGDIRQVLETLSKSISTISSELGAIRKIMEENRNCNSGRKSEIENYNLLDEI